MSENQQKYDWSNNIVNMYSKHSQDIGKCLVELSEIKKQIKLLYKFIVVIIGVIATTIILLNLLKYFS